MNTPDRLRMDFLGCPLDLVPPQELIAAARRAVEGGTRLRLEGLNVAKLVDARGDSTLMGALEDAERVHIDGAGISLGLKWLGVQPPVRRAGIDLLGDLCAMAVGSGASVYLLGARATVVEQIAQYLLARYPGLNIAGWRDGYFSPAQEPTVIEAIRASGADLLFIGMSSPRKEVLLQQHWPHLGVKVAMGVGGSFDVLSGNLPRAPRWMQKAGMEWLFRMALEPRRLLWRYVRTNTAFAFLLIVARLKMKWRMGIRDNA
ncbi:WecB/TagA/CpsF family glycosyltransferase [Pseudomonas silvicola]|nr:WecB/TagA/CpsF family glycosyltransferase [Pseudomonas silvicola]